MSRDIRKQLADPQLVAVCLDGEAWPHGLLSASRLPTGWLGLHVRPDGTRRLVAPGEEPDCGRGDKLVLVRDGPVQVNIGVQDVTCADQYAANGACELVLRWPARADDLAALRATLLGTPLTRDRLEQVVAAGGALTGLHRFIREHPARALLEEDLRGELHDALRAALQKFLFDTGAELTGLAAVAFSSESYQNQARRRQQAQVRIEQIRTREMVEAAAIAATRRQLDDLRGLLDKLRDVAGPEDTDRWHALLPALSPAQRGRLLENLWRITPDRHIARAIVVAAGEECLWLDPAEPEHVARRTTLPHDLGGLRSVTFLRSRNWLLAGAARGVWALDGDTGKIVARFSVPDTPAPRTGFNAATSVGGRLVATSSQLGCWSWALDDPTDARAILEPIDGIPRRIRAAVATDDGRALLAADDCVHVWDPRTDTLGVLRSADATIASMNVLDDWLFVGTTSGRLYRLSLAQPGDWWLIHQTTDAIETVQARRWNDLVEVVVPAGPRGVCGVFCEENVVTTLLESPTPIRRAWACDDVVLGLNHLRDRLVVMNANVPRRAGRVARIARLTGHTIQDACLVVATADAGSSPPEAQTGSGSESKRHAAGDDVDADHH